MRRRGIITMDAAFGLGLLALLLLVLTLATAQSRRSTRTLEQYRAALRTAERVLVQMRSGQPVTASDEPMTVEIIPDTPVSGSTDWQWATVIVEYENQHAQLTGLIPAESLSEVGP